ncbi:MAG TPA: transglycosylase domain-containing protein [Flavobacteriales bacterium]|nr:transglycosylase domain-containing protein [Flavobacteriales bacterium]
MAKKKGRKRPGKGGVSLGKILLILAASAFTAAFLLILLVSNNVFGKLPDADDLANLRHEEATLILSSEGAVIGKIFAKDRTNVRYKDIPGHVVDALVSTEDQRFFQHGGVDAFSYLRVFFRTIVSRDRGGGGGSTISQQLVKNLYGRERHGLLTVPVTKIKEAIVAQRLEQVYSKEDVITLYLNSVPFGENIYGIEAAAERYFSKSVRNLKVEEAAVLIGMLKANTAYNPRLYPQRAKGRRDQVLALMAGNGKITEAMKDSLQGLPLRIRYAGLAAYDAYGYFDARVERQARTILAELGTKEAKAYDLEKDGLRIHTTLDTALQQAALRAVRKQLSAMQPLLDRELGGRNTRKAWEKARGKKGDAAWKANGRARRELFTWDQSPPDSISYRDSLWHYHRMLQAAFLMVEPATGNVRAYSGGNDFRTLPYDQVLGRRQVASTIKPIIYAAGLERGLGPCTYLNNEEKTYAEYDGWTPRNFDKDTVGGQVALWHALAHSMNIPTVDLYFRTGTDTIRQVFRDLGLPDGGVDNPALALGAADISLQEMVRAYGAFAHRGLLHEPRFIEKVTDAQGKLIYQAKAPKAQRALPQDVAETVTAMLQRAVDSGTGAAMRSRFGVRGPLAGKTGTSQDYSDAWFVAYTPGLVAGTWVGAREPSIHFGSANGTGARLALPIIGATLAEVERSPVLRKKYMPPFPGPLEEVDMDCPQWRPVGFFERFFGGPRDGTDKVGDRDKDRQEGFFRRLFPRRN